MMKSGMASRVGDTMVEAHEPPFNLKNCGLILACIVAVTYCGEFPQIITALEAFRLVGWQSTTEAMDILYTNLLAILVANKKDDEIYETNERGNYDRAYAVRKMLLILRNVEPGDLKSSFCGCMRTCGSIILAVKDKMAQVAFAGYAFGQTIETYLTPYTRPMLIEMVDQDAKLAKWIPLFINVVAHSVGICFAMVMFRGIALYQFINILIFRPVAKLDGRSVVEWALDEAASLQVACLLYVLASIGSSYTAVLADLLLVPAHMLEINLAYITR